jgi:hypothetical protein
VALSRDRSGPDWRRVQGALNVSFAAVQHKSSKTGDVNSKADGDRGRTWLKYAGLKMGPIRFGALPTLVPGRSPDRI